MLKRKFSGNDDFMTPQVPVHGQGVTSITAGAAANEARFGLQDRHARRLRRARRSARGQSRAATGWSIGLW